MDILFHGLTGVVLAKALGGDPLLAVGFATLADTVGSSPFYIFAAKEAAKGGTKNFLARFVALSKQESYFGKLDELAYKITHSWLVLVPIGVLAYLVSPVYWYTMLLCYFIHLVVDVFTHDKLFSAQPLWPISLSRIGGSYWVTNIRLFVTFWVVLGFLFGAQILAGA